MRTGTTSVLAEFETGDQLLRAAKSLREQGIRDIEAYSPTPVEGLDEVLGQEDHTMPRLAFFGGLCGGLGGYALQWWVSADAYPLNVGGRPLYSWPAFIPITFECTILVASLTLAVGFFIANGFPLVYDPIFQAREFSRASRDRFFLTVPSTSNNRHAVEVEALLVALGATRTKELRP